MATVKLPWVSREAHDALMAEKDARIAALETEGDRLHAYGRDWHIAALDAYRKIDALTTAKPEPEPAAPAPAEPRKPNIVLDTIRDLAAGDLRMMQYLHQRKRELRAENPRISDDLLCLELMKWETSDNLLEGAE